MMDTSLRSSRHAAIVVPHDTNMMTRPAHKGIYVGGAGDVQLITATDEPVLFKNVPAGTVLPIDTKRVNVTNTTATFMVALS